MSHGRGDLGEDPGGIYGRMDFASRDRYRHIVEKTAKRCPHSEIEVARKAIQLAHEGAARKGGDDRAAHVGFYLIDKGLAQLERRAEVRLSLVDVLRKNRRSVSFCCCYGGTILLMTAVIAGCLAAQAYAGGGAGMGPRPGRTALICCAPVI